MDVWNFRILSSPAVLRGYYSSAINTSHGPGTGSTQRNKGLEACSTNDSLEQVIVETCVGMSLAAGFKDPIFRFLLFCFVLSYPPSCCYIIITAILFYLCYFIFFNLIIHFIYLFILLSSVSAVLSVFQLNCWNQLLAMLTKHFTEVTDAFHNIHKGWVSFIVAGPLQWTFFFKY